MRKVVLFLSLLLPACWLALEAAADVAPFPRPRPRPIPPIVREDPPITLLDKDTKIELDRAAVQVSLSRAASVVPRLGQPPLIREQQVVADVEAYFELRCKSSRISPANFTMAFPVKPDNGKDARDVQCTRFVATVDNQPASWTRSRLMQFGDSSFQGYIWPASIREGATQKVAVTYRLRLPVNDRSATFTYVLRSGGEWSGLVGRETVRVESQDGLKMKARQGSTLRPAEETDHKIVWDLKDTALNENITIDVMVP